MVQLPVLDSTELIQLKIELDDAVIVHVNAHISDALVEGSDALVDGSDALVDGSDALPPRREGSSWTLASPSPAKWLRRRG